MRAIRNLAKGTFVLLLLSIIPLSAAASVIVHEWGTFTCLQDGNGEAIKGINVDDEPVPPFVYDQTEVKVVAQYSASKGNFGLPPYTILHSKGWTPSDPQVTMRLETPVIYFYPPKGEAPSAVPPLDVTVDFQDGMLSQFYPYAYLTTSYSTLGKLNGAADWISMGKGLLYGMTSALTWKGVRLGSTHPPTETGDKVWTTPREVGAATLEVTAPKWEQQNGQVKQTIETQSEHFLFYRGVGHLNSPILLSRNGPLVTSFGGSVMNPDLSINASVKDGLTKLSSCWLIMIQPDGTCAFREPDTVTPEMKRQMESTILVPSFTQNWIGQLSTKFKSSEFSAAKLAELKASMAAALVKEGLYPEEASAMLRTWELSYFKSPGLRFFYIVPRAWTDRELPLKITGAPVEISRVMVGRIELITDEQKTALERLVGGPCPDLASFKNEAQAALQASKLPEQDVEAFYSGEKPLSDLGISIPPLIQDYLSLGRFRDALVIYEFQKRPSIALADFINQNGIAPPGMEIKGHDVLQLSPDLSLKNPGSSSAGATQLR